VKELKCSYILKVITFYYPAVHFIRRQSTPIFIIPFILCHTRNTTIVPSSFHCSLPWLHFISPFIPLHFISFQLHLRAFFFTVPLFHFFSSVILITSSAIRPSFYFNLLQLPFISISIHVNFTLFTFIANFTHWDLPFIVH
jgi:hypothetical protein